MNGSPTSRFNPVWLAALMAFLGVLSGALAQEPARPAPPSPLGTNGLGLSLRHRDCVPLEAWDQLRFAPEQTMLIVIGRCDLSRVPGGLEQFIRKGGAALIASDDAIANPDELIRLCGHTVNGGKVLGWDDRAAKGDELAVRTDAANVFQPGLFPAPEFVIVEPMPNAELKLLIDASDPNNPKPLRLITRLPSYLEQKSPELPRGTSVLARFPSGCAYNGSYLPKTATPPSFAVTAEVEDGRLLLMADQDPLLNYFVLELLQRRKLSDNADFLRNALDWLKQDRRTFVLLVVDGAVQTNLNPPAGYELAPFQEFERRLIQNANRQLLAIQDHLSKQNTLNSLMVNGVRDRSLAAGRLTSPFFIGAISLAAAAAAVFGFIKLRRASHRLEPGIPLLVNAVARVSPPLSTVQHRTRQALEEDNFGEYARALALEWLARLPGNSAAHDASVGLPVPHETPPRVVVQGSWFRRMRLRNMVREVWNLAVDEFPARMTRAQFQKLLDRVMHLRDAVAAGELSLEWKA